MRKKKKSILLICTALIAVMMCSFLLSGCSSTDYNGLNSAIEQYYRGEDIRGRTISMIVNVPDDRNILSRQEKIGGYNVDRLAFLGTNVSNSVNIAVLLIPGTEIHDGDSIDIYVIDIVPENSFTVDVIAAVI